MRIHRTWDYLEQLAYVVNCFQNTNFSEDSQGNDFKAEWDIVVNCFQNTNFSEDSQAITQASLAGSGCELLSEY